MSVRSWLLAGLLFAGLPAHGATTFAWTGDANSNTLGSADTSAGDTTCSVTGSFAYSSTTPKVGTHKFTTTDATDYCAFDGASITSIDTGTVGFWIQYKTAVPTAGLHIGVTQRNATNANDYVSTMSASSQEFRLSLRQNGGSLLNLDTTSVNAAVDTWYFVEYGYDIPNDDRYITVRDSACSVIETVSDTSTDLNAARAASSLDTLRFGNNSSHTSAVWFDNIIIVNTYAADIVDWCIATSFRPSFTSGPTAGTTMATSIPFTFTADQSGTVYGVCCTNGQTANQSQAVAGNCSGGAALGSFSEPVEAGVGDSASCTGLANSTTHDAFVTMVATIGGTPTSVSSLADKVTQAGGSPPSFSVSPSVSATDDDSITLSFTPSASATMHCTACPPAEAAGSAAQAIGGDCASGAAGIHVSKAVTGADTIVVSPLVLLRNDVNCALTNAGGDSSVASVTNQDRALRTGFAKVELASIATTGLADQDAYFTPDMAVGDLIEYEDETNEDSGCAVSIETDGDVVFTPAGAGDCDDRRTFELSYQDISTTTGTFTALTAGNFASDDKAIIGNSAPSCDTADQGLTVLTPNEAMSPIDLNAYWNDPDGDADSFTYTLATGTLFTGTSLNGVTGVIDGTPTAEDENGEALEFEGCDESGVCATCGLTLYAVTSWAEVDCDGLDLGTCADLRLAAAPWLGTNPLITIAGYQCDPGTPSGEIIDQDPAATTAAGAFDGLSVTIARSCGTGGGGKKQRLRTSGGMRVIP